MICINVYCDFIYNNKVIFVGKIVFDIGCGIGIFFMFVVKVGVVKVFVVDNSVIIDKVCENIFNNGFDNVIICICGKIEEVIFLVFMVDIIVLEWMGYCFFYEVMFFFVFYVRDKYFKFDIGFFVLLYMLMWIVFVVDEEYVIDNMDFWWDVYGFDMKVMQEGIYVNCCIEYFFDVVVVGIVQCFRMFDFYICIKEDFVFNEKWMLIYMFKDKFDGFLVWFDIFFCELRQEQVEKQLMWKQWMDVKGKESVVFIIGLFDKEMYWRQGLMLIDYVKQLKGSEEKVKEGVRLEGEIEYVIFEGYYRGLNIKVIWGLEGEEGEKRLSQMWMCYQRGLVGWWINVWDR